MAATHRPLARAVRAPHKPPMPIPAEFGLGRTAIVTGGARRIGAALARALAQDGWPVLIHYQRSRREAEALAAEIGADTVMADLADPGAAAMILAAAGPAPALLVNNASGFAYDTHADFGLDQWAAHMDVNLRAPALLTRAFAAATPQGARGLVVNMLDAKLASLNPDYFSYTVSKAGLAAATELAARAFAPAIRVNAIAPSITLVSGPQSRERFEAVHAANPLGVGVEVEDIARALRFIVATPSLSAQVITLDGGQRLMGLPRDVAYL
jgi:NAD(P)-dependent dehydrogenase (short-subunit alcohol dehydrogenase family)